MSKQKALNKQRQRRQYRVRNKIRGTADRPRLSVTRSSRHIGVQLIDDVTRRTLAAASTLEPAIRSAIKHGGNKDAAALVGKAIAERAGSAGIKAARLDRGHNRYHGRIAALANAAREAGLEF